MIISVREFNAKGDGSSLETKAIQNAIDECEKEGGGMVMIPPGDYLVGTINLKDNVSLYLMNGSRLLGSKNIEDYESTNELPEGDRLPWHLLQAINKKNVSVKGEGTIDGQGKAYWDDGTYVENGIVKERGYYRHPLKNSVQKRPSAMIYFKDCKNIKLDGFYIRGAAGWNMHLYRCSNVKISNLDIESDKKGPNTDGIDINGGENIDIGTCSIKVGDDAISLKTTEEAGECRFISIHDCFLSSRTCGVKYGSETFHAFRGLTCTNLTITESERAFGIYAFDGGTIEDVIFSNCIIRTKGTYPNMLDRPIHIVSRRENSSSSLSKIKNLIFKDIVIHSKGRVIVSAMEEKPVENIIFENVIYEIDGNEDINDFLCPIPSDTQFQKYKKEVRMQKSMFVLDCINGLIVKNIMISSSCCVDKSDYSVIWERNVTNKKYQDIINRGGFKSEIIST